MNIEFTDNSDKIKSEFKKHCARALERCGEKAEGYAADLAPVARYMGGTLKQSITHQGDDTIEYVGTDCDYAVYVELGTGKYYQGGRKTPWVYKDSKTGKFYRTSGQPAKAFIKPAVADHAQTYRNIIDDEMRNG